MQTEAKASSCYFTECSGAAKYRGWLVQDDWKLLLLIIIINGLLASFGIGFMTAIYLLEVLFPCPK